MYPGSGLTGLLGVFNIIGLLVIGYFFWKLRKRFKELFPEKESDSQKEGVILIKERLDKLLSAVEETQRREEVLKKSAREMSLDGLNHLQKVSLLRYNPYGDTGGDMSFSLSLLDGKSNGIILTSLHTRSGTRIYSKQVKEGKSELSLSKEEAQVLREALNQN